MSYRKCLLDHETFYWVPLQLLSFNMEVPFPNLAKLINYLHERALRIAFQTSTRIWMNFFERISLLQLIIENYGESLWWYLQVFERVISKHNEWCLQTKLKHSLRTEKLQYIPTSESQLCVIWYRNHINELPLKFGLLPLKQLRTESP